MSVTNSDIPQIAITHDEVENEDSGYLPINEVLTDTEDLIEDDKVSCSNKKCSKLKIVFNTDTYTTDVEDIDFSDDNQEDEELVSHPKPIDIEEIDLEQGTIEESYKNNVKLRGGKNIKTVQKNGTVPANYKIYDNYTDEELFDTDNEMQSNDAPNNNFNANSFDSGFTKISDNNTLRAHASSTTGYLSAQSLSPNLSDLTDVEIIESGSEEEVNKKKSKSKRKKRNHTRAVTDTEDLEFSDNESTKKTHNRKSHHKSKSIPKSISLNFESSKEDEEPLFPVCKKIAEKRPYILNIPEFDMQTNTDTEDFASIIDIGSPQEEINDLELDDKVEQITDCCSQITESQSSTGKNIEHLKENQVIKTSELEVESDESESENNKTCNTDTYSERVEHLNISTEAEDCYDDNELKQLPEIELPSVVRNITVFSEKNGVPTISVLPLEDSSCEEDEINDRVTDEESISDIEETSTSVQHSPLVEIPDMDWGVISVKEESHDQDYKNINEIDVSIIKRKRPPKFKYLYEKQNKLTVKQENIGNITDTEDLAIDDKKAKEFNYVLCDKPSEEKITNGTETSDTEGAVTSTDDDLCSHSRTETPTVNLLQKEFDRISISEVNVKNTSKPLSEGVMYLKGGGYYLKVTDVEDLSEDDIGVNADFCGCEKSSQSVGSEFCEKEWESQKDELQVDKLDGTVDKKVDVPSVSSTQKNEVSISSHSITSPLVTPQTSYAQIDTMLEKIFGEIDQLSPDEDPFDHQNSENKDQCKSSLELQPSVDVTIEVPIKKCIKVPKKYTTSKELCIDENQINSATETDVAVKTVPVETKQDDIKNYNLKLDLEKAFSFSPTEEFDNEGSQEYIKNDKDVIEDFPITENIADSKLIELAREITQFIDQERFNTMSNSTKTYTDAVPLDCNIITDDMKDSCFKSGLDPTFAPKATEEIMSDENSKSHIEDNLLKSTDELRNQNEDVPHYVDREPLQGLFVESFKPKDRKKNVFRITLETAFVSNINNTNIDKHETERISKPLMKDKKTNSEKLHYSTESINLRTPSYLPTCTSSVEKNDLGDELLSKYLKELDESVNKIDDTLKNEHEHNDKSNNVINIVQVNGKSLINPDKIASQEQHIPEDFKYKVDNMTDNLIDFNDVIYLEDDEFQKSQGRVQVTDLDQISEPDMSDVIDTFENVPENSNIWWEGTYRDIESPIVDKTETILDVPQRHFQESNVFIPYIKNIISIPSSSADPLVIQAISSSSDDENSLLQSHKIFSDKSKNAKADVKVLVTSLDRDIEIKSVKDLKTNIGASRKFKKRSKTLPGRSSDLLSRCKNNLLDNKRYLSEPLLLKAFAETNADSYQPSFTLQTLFEINSTSNSTGGNDSQKSFKLLPVSNLSFPLEFDVNSNRQEQWPEQCNSDCKRDDNRANEFSLLVSTQHFHEKSELLDAYCDWLLQQSEETCNVHLTEALLTTQPMPLPKPRSKMLDTDFPSNETEVVPTKPKSPVRDDLLDEDEVPESYLDKKKFWENVTQEHSHKRYSLQDTGLSEKESFKKKQLSMQDFTSSPVPKPRTLHSSQSLVESTSSITQERSEGTSSKTSDEDISIQERRQKQNILSFDLKLQKKSQDKKKKVSTDELAQKGSGQNSENLGYISDSEDVEHYISDSEIEDRVPQIRDRMMSVFVPSASSTACRSIYERSASLPTEDLYEVSARTIKARKEYYEEQIRKEMIEEQLTSELEEEPSPERKNLLLSSTEEDHTEADAKSIGEDVEDIREEHAYDTKKKTETKSIDHKVITEERISTSSSKVTEHIPQSEYIEEMSFIQKSKLNEPRNGISKITHDDFQFKVDKDNEHKLFETQHSISSDKSGDHIDEQNFRDDSHSTKPDSMEVLVDKSELEDSEKLADLDQDIEGKSIESLDIDESPKQTFVDTELKNGHFDREDRREKFTDECQRDVNIKLPQENIQNVVWEVSVESASKNAFSEQADDLHVQEVVRVTEKFSEVKSVSKIPILKKNEPSKSVVKDDVVIEKKDIEKQSKIPKPETEIKLPKTGDVKLLDETAKFIELESRYNPDSPTELQKSSKEQSKTSKYSDVEFESSHILPARKKDLVTKVDETAKFDKSKIKDDIQTFIESETKHTTDYTRISELQKLEPNKNKDTQNTVTDRLKKDTELDTDIDKCSKSKADVEVKQEKLTETAKNKEEIVSDFDKVKVKKSTRDFLENETKHITDYTSQYQKLDRTANIQQQTEVSTLSKVASAKEPNRTEERGYNFDQAKLKTDTEQFLGTESKHVTDYTKVIQSSDYVVTKTDQTLKDTGAERKSEDDKKEKISDRIDPIKFKTETENFLEFESRHNTDRVKENSQFVKEYDSQLLIKKDVVNLEKENEEMSEKNIKKSVISGETKPESSSKALETATMTEKYADKILKEKTNAKTVETKIDTQKFIELESQYNTDFNSHTIKKDSSISKPVHSLATGMVEKELGKSQGTKIDKKETKDQEKTDEIRLTESNRIKIAEDVASFIESESNYNTDYEQITKPRKDPKNTVKIVIDDVKSETSKKLDKLAAESKKTESETEKKSKLKTDTQGQSEIEKLIFDCLQQQKVHPDEALKIANALVEEIEAEIQKHDSLGTEPIEKLEEKTNIPEFLRHLAETKGLDQREVELVESVLARKRRGFDKLSRGDTQASSVEITDEDLKYSGTDLEYSQVLEQQIDQLEAEKVSNLDSESFEEPSDNSQSKTTFIEKTGEEHSEDTEWSHDFGSNEDTNILAMKKGGFMKTHENIVSEKVKIVDDKVCSDDDKSVSEKISEESEISKTKIETVIAEDSHILLKDLEIKASQTGTAEVQADHISNVTYDKIKIIDKDKPEEITLEQTQVASDDKVSAIYNAESHQTEMSKDKIKQINKKTEEKYDELNKEQEKVLKKESISIKVADDGSQIKTKEDIDKTFSVKSSTTITQTHQREETSSTTLTEDTEAKEIFGDELLKELESGEVKTIVETHEVVRRTSSNELKDVGYSKKDDSDSPSVVLRKSKSDTSSSSPKMKPDRKSGYDYEINSSSGESHYQSFEMDSNKSRPCSSDVEGLIAAGSSEYESALTSQIYSAKSQISTDYKTVSSMSSKDSMKSLDSESSGNLASVEVSEHSETLVPSTSDLDDILDSVDHQLLADESELNEQNLVWSNRSMDTHHLNEVSDSEGLSFAGVDESMEASEEESPELKTTEVQSKMKRSCEMTFQPEPKILAPESPHADSEDKIGTSLDDGSIFSTSMSSTSSTGAQRTVIEQSRADSDRLEGSMNVSSEHLSLEDVDSIPRGSIDSVIIPSNLTSNGSPTALPAGITEAFTDEMLVLDDGNQMILGKQSTEESTTSVTSATAPEQKKKGHKRTESTVLVGTLTRFSTEQYESEKKSGSQLSSKEISFEDKQDIDEREKCDTRTSSQVSSLDKESDTGAELLNGSKAQPQTSISDSGHPIFVSDDKLKNELTNADKSTDLSEESSIPTSSPDPLAKFKFDDFPTPKTVKEFEHKDRDHFDRKGEIHHEKKNVEEGEAEAVFSMVPPISPAHKIKEIQPILEDDVAEKHELESQERIKKDTVVVTTAILKDASPVPDIKITQHMAPLVDNNFHYPELELESKERQQEQQQETLTDTPQTPASNSSKSSEETDQGREYVLNESVSTIQEEPEGTVDEPKKGTKQKQTFKEKKGTDSPDSSDSFEMLEKPDLIDDFVVIEEVGKEAHELDTEGKSVKIAKVPKPAKKHDEEVEQYLAHSAPTPLTRMTDIKYYPDGSSTEGAPFDFEESPPQVAQEKTKKESDSQYDKELEANKKWVEQQFQGDHATMIAAGYGYEMDFERGPLEDIKEEDITDFAASSYGSQKDSGGSVKESYSSTPEYDVLAGRKYFTRSGEHDDTSMSSLQEFENLEQAMSLEMRRLHQGSQDSSSNGSFKTRYIVSKSGQGDDISVSSLKEFEGLEKACIAAHKIEIKVKEEEALLAQIEEGQESIASESESCETISGTEKKAVTDTDEEDYEKRMFEIDEIIKQAQSNVERFVDLKDVEKTESLGRGDSVEEVSKVPDLDLDTPVVKSTIKVQWKENEDVMMTSTDSLEQQIGQTSRHDSADSLDQETAGNIMTTSTDSLEAHLKKSSKDNVVSDSMEGHGTDKNYIVSSDSLDLAAAVQHTDTNVLMTDSMDEDSSKFGPYDHSTSSTGKDLNSSTKDDFSQDKDDEHQADNLDISSSAATHATYQYETDSVFSGSFTSGGSNTMVSSTNSLDQARQGTSVDLAGAVRQVWFDEDDTGDKTITEFADESSKPYVTEIIEPSSDDYYSHVIHRKVELPPEVRKITFTGADADEQMKKFLEEFKEGEECEETEEIDSDGNIHIRKVLTRRIVVKDDGGQQAGPEIEEYFRQLNQPEVMKGKGIIGSNISEDKEGKQEFAAASSSKSITKHSRDMPEMSTSSEQPTTSSVKASRRRPLRCEISIEDQTEVDPREHDWRFNLPKHAEGEEGSDKEEIDKKTDQQ